MADFGGAWQSLGAVAPGVCAYYRVNKLTTGRADDYVETQFRGIARQWYVSVSDADWVGSIKAVQLEGRPDVAGLYAYLMLGPASAEMRSFYETVH